MSYSSSSLRPISSGRSPLPLDKSPLPLERPTSLDKSLLPLERPTSLDKSPLPLKKSPSTLTALLSIDPSLNPLGYAVAVADALKRLDCADLTRNVSFLLPEFFLEHAYCVSCTELAQSPLIALHAAAALDQARVSLYEKNIIRHVSVYSQLVACVSVKNNGAFEYAYNTLNALEKGELLTAFEQMHKQSRHAESEKHFLDTARWHEERLNAVTLVAMRRHDQRAFSQKMFMHMTSWASTAELADNLFYSIICPASSRSSSSSLSYSSTSPSSFSSLPFPTFSTPITLSSTLELNWPDSDKDTTVRYPAEEQTRVEIHEGEPGENTGPFGETSRPASPDPAAILTAARDNLAKALESEKSIEQEKLDKYQDWTAKRTEKASLIKQAKQAQQKHEAAVLQKIRLAASVKTAEEGVAKLEQSLVNKEEEQQKKEEELEAAGEAYAAKNKEPKPSAINSPQEALTHQEALNTLLTTYRTIETAIVELKKEIEALPDQIKQAKEQAATLRTDLDSSTLAEDHEQELSDTANAKVQEKTLEVETAYKAYQDVLARYDAGHAQTEEYAEEVTRLQRKVAPLNTKESHSSSSSTSSTTASTPTSTPTSIPTPTSTLPESFARTQAQTAQATSPETLQGISSVAPSQKIPEEASKIIKSDILPFMRSDAFRSLDVAPSTRGDLFKQLLCKLNDFPTVKGYIEESYTGDMNSIRLPGTALKAVYAGLNPGSSSKK